MSIHEDNVITLKLENDHLNDLNYVHKKYTEACINTLKQISNENENLVFSELIKEFIEDIERYYDDDEFLNKWDIKKSEIMCNVSKPENPQIEKEKEEKEETEETEAVINKKSKKKMKIVKKIKI